MTGNPTADFDALLDRQTNAWQAGGRPDIADLLRGSAVPPSPAVLLDLIYNEIVAREGIGESPSPQEYIHRYPELGEDLQLHFEVHRAVGGGLLGETPRTWRTGPDRDAGPGAAGPGPTPAGYDIVGELGRGGMGVVYKARHRRLGRFVALKMFQPGRAPTPRELARFRAEAGAIARLHHPNIVQIFEITEHGGLPCLALEWAENGTLQQQLLDLPYAPRAAAGLVRTLAAALQHAHDSHVVHRDLKPANILFAADGTPKVTDFGLARVLGPGGGADDGATRSGEPVGTPRYMAPEQAAGRPDRVGPGTDVYALGTLLYECLTGQPPFVSASVVETLDRIRHEPPAPPRRRQRGVPRDLETICLKCLEKEPGRRYATAQALADDLGRFLRGEPVRGRRTPAWERGWKWCRRHPAVATGAAAAVAAVAAGLIAFAVHRGAERRRVTAVRLEVEALMVEGRSALLRGDGRAARERFQAALAKVQAEPALGDHELGVRGWLDHSHRPADQQVRRGRHAPPTFEERRDWAFLVALFSDAARPGTRRAAAADAVEAALEFTPPGDPAWCGEREALLVLRADLALADGDAARALAALGPVDGLASRLALLRRADALESLGRRAEARRDRGRAAGAAPQPTVEGVFRGLGHARRGEHAAAVEDFDAVLAAEPDHFLARCLQGWCLLELRRPGEAKVALTACLGQRPLCAWSRLFRGEAYLQLGLLALAAQDFQTAAELSADAPLRGRLDQDLAALARQVAGLPPEQQAAFWDADVATEDGPRPLRQAPLLAQLQEG